jgi:hypothetical protein
MKFLKTFEGYTSHMTREEMIEHLCNSGFNKIELDEKNDDELSSMCRDTPIEMSED